MGKKKVVEKTGPLDAQTAIGSYNDGKFVRTALVIDGTENTGSVDVLDKKGHRVAQLNIFVGEDGALMVDVIDVENRYKVKRALAFAQGQRTSMTVPDGGNLVGVDFRKDARGD